MQIKSIISVLSLIVVLASCSSEKKIEHKSIYLQNTMSIDRVDEAIVLKESYVKGIVANKDAKYIYFETVDGNKIPFQLDEINGVNEYSLECDFKANEKKQILIKVSDKPVDDFKHYTNIRLGKDSNNDGVYDDTTYDLRDPNHLPGSIPVLYQMEGISWENDKVGFRTYWDKRNGKDIWGKTTSEMVMDSIGLPNTPSYHVIQDWGTDVLKVGTSLGAGALAMIKDGNLVRLGDTESATFKILAEGPVRSVFELDYKGWTVGNETYNLKQLITIWKGKDWYQSDVVIDGKDTDNIQLVTGITNIAMSEEDRKYTQLDKGSNTIVYTFGKQTEQNELLGLALIIDKDSLNKIIEAPNEGNGRAIDGNSPISHTFYTDTKKGNKISFKFISGWERSEEYFKTAKGFESNLILEANKLDSAIVVLSE